MTLRPETVRERLAFVRRNLALLTRTASVPRAEFLGDLEKQWAVAYGLQVTAQSLLDASAHILTAALGEAPRDYGEIVALLARHGILDATLAGQLRGLGGFRNVLVHEYAEVDFALVHARLAHLGDLLDLAAALERWLEVRGV